MAEPGLSEIITTTGRLRMKVLRDDVQNNNAVLLSMEEHDGIVMEDGGRTIIEEMAYAENGSFIRYDGNQVMNTTYNPTMTSAEFDWKQFGCAVVISGREQRMNSGSEGFIKLLAGRYKIAEYTLRNNYNADMLSDGTASSGKQIGGLALIVATVNTNVVGGINRSTAGGAFYRNFAFDTTAGGGPAAGDTTAANVKTYLNYCINSTTRLTDRVKLLLMGQTHYEALQSATQAIQRFDAVDPKLAKLGFENMIYMGIPAILGGGKAFGSESLVTTTYTYGLNTEFLKMRVHKDANMEPLPEVQSINQDEKVQLIVWMGNMTSSGPGLSFVMFDS